MSTHLATEYDKAEDSPGLLLWQLTNKWQAKQRAALQPFDLTHVQFVLLATLTYTDDKHSLTQKQLAEYAQLDVMMTSQVVRKLEQKELVTRTSSSVDGRALSVSPTPKGIRLVNQAIKSVEYVDRQFFDRLGADKQQFIVMLRKMYLDLR